MRRLVLTAAVVSFALLPLTLYAQRGGGMHGGGFSGHAGFSSHAGMRAGGFSSGMRGGPPGMMSGVRSHNGFHSSGIWHSGFHHGNGPRLIIGSRFVGSRFRNPYYAYAPFGYYSPFWWDWYSSSSYDRSDNNDNYVAQRQAQQQIDDLSQQVQDLQQAQGERAYSQAPVPRPPAPANTEAKIEPAMSVVLVYLDRRIEEIKNYAVANEKVVVFDNHHIKKIPLADIDLAATMKLNDERGVDFQIPNPAGTE
jgi:hypothetical protein